MASQKPSGKASGRRLGLPKRALSSTPPELPREPSPPPAPAPDAAPELSILVDILEGTTVADALSAAVARERGGTPAVVTTPQIAAMDETSPREAAAFDEVARSLAAAEACVPLLAQSTGLMRLAALDVVKAETTRAGGLLQLLRFLRGDVVPVTGAVSSSAVVQRVVQAAESERRIRGISLATRSSVSDVVLAGDETLLANTVLALLLITFAALEGVPSARVTLSVSVGDEGEVTLTVSQDHVAAPATWSTLDEGAADAAAVSGVAIAAAHRLAATWDGTFTVTTAEHATAFTIALPMLRAAAKSSSH